MFSPSILGELGNPEFYIGIFDNVETHKEPYWVKYPNKPAKRFSSKTKLSKMYHKKKKKQQKQSRKNNR